MARKLKVAVLFGGRSGEHEASLRSGASIMHALDRNKYDVVPIGIPKQGSWLVAVAAAKMLPNGVGRLPRGGARESSREGPQQGEYMPSGLRRRVGPHPSH